MRRGTTPTHIFNTSTDLSDAEIIFVTYEQNGKQVIEKTKADVTFGQMQMQVKLTQEETLGFDIKAPVEIQIRAKFADGSAIASNIMRTSAQKILKEGEI